MKGKIYVFSTQYVSLPETGAGMNRLFLVATFEADAWKDAQKFVSAGVGIYYVWNGGVDVEEAK